MWTRDDRVPWGDRLRACDSKAYYRAPSRFLKAGIKMDLDSHRVTRDGHQIHLSPKCFRLLETLIDRPTYVFSRDALLGKVWGGDVYVEARTVDVHIRRLRKALDVNDGPEVVRTVRSAGYSLDITPNIM